MTDIATLVIKADTSQVKTATNDLNKLSSAGNKAQTSSQSLTSSFVAMRGALAGLGISVTVGQLVKIADSYTKITSQLKLATRGQLEFNEAYKNVQRIASDSQSGIEETALLYARLSNALRDMNATQQQVSDITEAVSLGLKISGASAAEASSAMLQLSQAFSSGVLRGEEFNALNEAAPRLMTALAESLGVTRGELRAMAQDGKLTSDIVGNALLKSIGAFRKEAEQVKTIGGGLTGVTNEFTLLIGEIDKATGASNLLASALKEIANSIKDMRSGQSGWLSYMIQATPLRGLAPLSNMISDNNAAGRTQSGMIRKAGTGGLLTPPKTSPSASGTTSRTASAKAESMANNELAETYATLYESLQRLNDVDKSQIDLLREKLNSITNADKATKDYINSQLDLIEADQERKELIAENVRYQMEFNAEAERIKDAIDPTRQYNREVEKLKEFYAAGRITAKEYGLAVTAAQERMTSFAKTTKDEFEELKDAINGFSRDATNSLVDFAFGASASFEQMANDFAKAITKMIIQKQLMDPLFNAISGGMSSGNFSGIFGSVFGGLFGGNDIAPSASPTGIIGASYANGSQYIPRDMFAQLHQGERVLTKEENRDYSQSKQQPVKQLGNVVMNFMVSGQTDMRTQQQIAAAAFGGISRAYRRNA